MSRVFKDFYKYLVEEGRYAKIFGTHSPGSRIEPPKNNKNDQKHQLRLDAGPVVDGKKYVNLQINSQAKNEALKKYARKHGFDAKLATATVDENTPKKDMKKDFDGFWGSMEGQAKDKLN
ncbi:MAG: hypothetical protein Q9183_003449 [Haloplaca sp. 2 TL-2023]